MRIQLQDLIGKVVCYRGWEVSARNDGSFRCFKNVRLNLWDWDEGIYHCATRKPGVFVDHLWMSNEAYSRSNGKQFYKQLMGVARVMPYTRANRSRDLTLSVKNMDLHDIDILIKHQNQMFHAGTPDDMWIPFYREALDLISQHEQHKNVVCYCASHRISKIKKTMEEELAMLEHSQKNVAEKLKTATMNGTCDQLKSLDLKANIKKRTTKPAGF